MKAIAGVLQWWYVEISPSTLPADGEDRLGANLKRLMEKVRDLNEAVIFIDKSEEIEGSRDLASRLDKSITNEFLKQAFVYDYQENGPSLLRAVQTCLRGYEYRVNHTDPRIRRKAEQLKGMLEMMRYSLVGSGWFCRGRMGRQLLREIKSDYSRLLGKRDWKTWALSLGFALCSIKEYVRITLFTDVRQPKTLYTPADSAL